MGPESTVPGAEPRRQSIAAAFPDLALVVDDLLG
jgi:hypothetical protein